MKARTDWHKSFFRNSFYNPADKAALAKAPEEAAFVLRQLGLGRGDALLDLCCGPGRHAVEFARAGLAVTGYDFSAEYLREAAARAAKRGTELRLKRGDMRALPYRGEFDAAVNLFTSFGYFLKPSDDLRTLKGVARALRPDGLFLIDVLNGAYARRHFYEKYWYDMGDFFHLEEVELNDDGAVNTWTRVSKKDGRTKKNTFFTRFYDRPRLTAALKKAGLKPLRFWGGFDGRPLSGRASRLICLAYRP